MSIEEGTNVETGQKIPTILVGISFDDSFRAREFITAAQGMAHRKELALDDAVLIVKDEGGRTTVTETTDLSGGRTALSGAVWAGLFGLVLGGPVGWVAGLAAGGAAGAVAAKAIDLGISDDWVKWFREAIEAGSATVALLVSEVNEEALLAEAKRFTGSQLIYTNFNDDMIDRLSDALGDHDGPDIRTDPTDT
jgi:uncharacterized membrane protein